MVNSSTTPKVRIIVRPWQPRTVPRPLQSKDVESILHTARPKLKKVLYIGWARRRINGVSQLHYLAATGDTTSEARRTFKSSQDFGETIWKLNSTE